MAGDEGEPRATEPLRLKLFPINIRVYRGDYVTQENRPQQTFVEWVLNLLEEKFPWLGKEEDAQISGADTVDELNDLHQELKEQIKANGQNVRRADD